MTHGLQYLHGTCLPFSDIWSRLLCLLAGYTGTTLRSQWEFYLKKAGAWTRVWTSGCNALKNFSRTVTSVLLQWPHTEVMGYFCNHNGTMIANISTTFSDSDVFLGGVFNQCDIPQGAVKWHKIFSTKLSIMRLPCKGRARYNVDML